MSAVFLSYSRESAAAARSLAADVEALGHTVWLDQELTGGQAWWERILETLRRCDALVLALTRASLSSVACRRECDYAAALRKPIVPVLLDEHVSPNLLPPGLAQLEYVDYRSPDRAAGLRLARALATVPREGALPDPLPPPPEPPISYLGALGERIASKAALTYEQQSALVVDLRRGLRERETAADADALLKELRKRRDLYAAIAEEIDGLAGGAPGSSDRERGGRTEAPVSRKGRRVAAAILFAGGWLAGTLCMGAVGAGSLAAGWGLLLGAAGAIAGAMVGLRRSGLLAAVGTSSLGWLVVAALASRDGAAWGAVLGAPLGAILGALGHRGWARARPARRAGGEPAPAESNADAAQIRRQTGC